ncbi:PREDICTED: uncharacterized protein LOC105556426, partial [Vollenhovia emeryi]|uniref:uncharacterized protein LOC105556426 n=1 Tax=Vollenhovia emeryi TaxID=411798 RepID=UPI0005F3F9B2
MVERRIQEVVGESFQRMEDLIRSLVGGGARDSGAAAIPSNPRKGGGGAMRGRPVPGADQGGGAKGANPPEKDANDAGEGTRKKKRKKKKKVPLSRQTQRVEEAGPSNTGTAKPPQPAAGVETYVTVLGRKSRAAEKKAAKGASRAAAPGPPAKGRTGGAPKRAPRRRVPRTSAVVVTRPSGDYRETIAMLRQSIKLEDLGIGGRINIRYGATGARVIKVTGEGHADKADLLAERIRQVLPEEEGTRVDRPRKMAEVRLRDLDDSLGVEEVRGWVADAARCSVSDVQCGALQPAAGGTFSLWARLPLTAAKEISQQGRIRVGWVMARVALLEARPMRCHRCLERGHTRAMCSSEGDRSGRCYRCGEAGHTSRDCRSAPKCPLCTDKGRPAKHVLGAKSCAQKNVRGRPPGQRAMEQAPATGAPPPAEARPTEEEKEEAGGPTQEPQPQHQPSGAPRKRASPPPEAMEANVNHSPQAQDLLQQSMVESGFTLAIVSEPHRPPRDSPYWAVDNGQAGDSVAIRWRSVPGGPGTTVIEKGQRHVAVQWGPIAVVGVYLRPTRRLALFRGWLSDIGRTVLRLSPRPVLVAGDFNAWHTSWGSRRTNSKGQALDEWAAEHGLVLRNEGRTPTCVRTQGESIVDLTWATSSAARLITGWRVERDIETLSDHRYITVELGVLSPVRRQETRPRWALRKLRGRPDGL